MTSNSQTDYQCLGCGALIQTNDETAMGYLPQSAFEKGLEKGDFYCQRCFRLRHYNELQDIKVDEDIFLEKLSSIAEDQAFVVQVIDIFDFEGSIITGLQRLIGQQDFVVAANKVDLLPKAIKPNRIIHWLKGQFHDLGLKPKEVFLVSAKRPDTLQGLIEMINDQVRQRNVYIVGVTNVGKSTLINQLISHYGGDREIITTSDHPGTTLDLIRIPLTEQTALIDTPGIIKQNQLAYYLDRKGMKQVLPRKTMKPKTFQLNPGQTLFLGGLGRIDFLAGDKTSFTAYVSNDLYIHRTKTDQADQLYTNQVGDLLTPPYSSQLSDFPKLVSRDFQLQADQDIAISGLGWLTSNQAGQVRVWAPQGIQVSLRTGLI